MDTRPATRDDSLPELLAAAARGDRVAFRALYEATAPKLFGVILRIVGNRSVAEEVLQETYIKIWRNAERFEPGAGHPMAWLAAIAKNRAIDRIRSERIERHSVGDGEEILERLAAPDSGDPMMRRALLGCLKRLDEDVREYVILAYCSGFSREELAERFGRPVGTIKTILHRSMKLLRICLEQE